MIEVDRVAKGGDWPSTRRLSELDRRTPTDSIRAKPANPAKVTAHNTIIFGAGTFMLKTHLLGSSAPVTGLALALLVAVPGPANASVTPRPPVTIVAGKSVGPVRLGEPLALVTHDLGRGRTVSPRFRRYKSAGLTINVGFSRSYRVDSLETTSPRARLYGHPLTEGYRRSSSRLLRHGWKTFRCEGIQVATRRGRGGATTAQFRRDQLLSVQISVGGGSTGKCGTGSPANPVP